MAGGGKKKKPKATKVSLNDFNSQSGAFSARNQTTRGPADDKGKLLASLPKFARGEDASAADDRYGDRAGAIFSDRLPAVQT